MRIIGGQAKRRQLLSPKGLAIRPTSDKVREALFDILGERMYNLSKKVHRLPLRLGLASRHSTTKWGNCAQG